MWARIILNSMNPSQRMRGRKEMGCEIAFLCDLICCRSNGLPIKPKCFSSDVRDTIRKAGLSLRFHDLRHSHATHLSMQGTSLKVIQERLGHTSLSTTMNTYLHAAPNVQREASEQLNQSLRARLPGNNVQRTEELE